MYDDTYIEPVLPQYGVKKRSGRYPWGSGGEPYQHSGDFLSRFESLKKEGEAADFTPAARKWGHHIPNTPLIHHINKEGVEKFYLETRFLNASKPTYIFQGNPIAKETIENYLVKSNSNAEHQGLSEENEVIIRDFELSGIRSIKVLGKHYEII